MRIGRRKKRRPLSGSPFSHSTHNEKLVREDVYFPRREFLAFLKTQGEHAVLVFGGDLVGVQVFVKLKFEFVAPGLVGIDSVGVASLTGDGEESSLGIDSEFVLGHAG